MGGGVIHQLNLSAKLSNIFAKITKKYFSNVFMIFSNMVYIKMNKYFNIKVPIKILEYKSKAGKSQ